MAEIFNEPILSERTLKYRRNVLALSVILIAMYWYADQIEIGGLSFFGIKWRNQSLANSQIVEVLALFLGYHLLAYAFYSIENFRVWKSGVLARRKMTSEGNFFPELRMFFGFSPSIRPSSAAERGAYQFNKSDNSTHPSVYDETAVWNFSKTPDRMIWGLEAGEGSSPGRNLFRFYVARPEFVSVRQKIWAFFIWDVALPMILVVAAARGPYQLLTLSPSP